MRTTDIDELERFVVQKHPSDRVDKYVGMALRYDKNIRKTYPVGPTTVEPVGGDVVITASGEDGRTVVTTKVLQSQITNSLVSESTAAYWFLCFAMHFLYDEYGGRHPRPPVKRSSIYL